MSDEANTEQPTAFSFGKRFSTARAALNLSREEVAKELRLGVEIISALESEDHEQLSAPIYVTGYIRNYARLLKIPAEPLLAAYNKLQVESPTIVSNAIPKRGPSYSRVLIKIASLSIVLVLIAGIASWFQSQNFEPSTWFSKSEEVESAEPLVALPQLAEEDDVPSTKEAEIVVSETENVIATEAESEPVIEAEPAIAVPEPVIEAESEPAKPVTEASKPEMVINLSSDSWADIQDSTGKQLIYGLLRSGKEYRLTGIIPFKVFLGNAKGVRIEYNGQLIDIEQHIRGNLARFQIGVAGE